VLTAADVTCGFVITILDTPNSVFDTPTSVFDTPPSIFDPPTSVFDTPTSVFDTPTSIFDPPTSFDAPPTSVTLTLTSRRVEETGVVVVVFFGEVEILLTVFFLPLLDLKPAADCCSCP